MKRNKHSDDPSALELLVAAAASIDSLDELMIRIAADTRLLNELRKSYDLMHKRRVDVLERLQALCRAHGIAVSYFDKRVFYLAHVLGLVSRDDDPYAVLGVERGASTEEIKQAYRRLSLQWHPDKNPHRPNATEIFIKVQEAYQALSDPVLRRHYEGRPLDSARLPSIAAEAAEPTPKSRRRHGVTRFVLQLGGLVAVLLAITLLGDFQNLLSPKQYGLNQTGRSASETAGTEAGMMGATPTPNLSRGPEERPQTPAAPPGTPGSSPPPAELMKAASMEPRTMSASDPAGPPPLKTPPPEKAPSKPNRLLAEDTKGSAEENQARLGENKETAAEPTGAAMEHKVVAEERTPPVAERKLAAVDKRASPEKKAPAEERTGAAAERKAPGEGKKAAEEEKKPLRRLPAAKQGTGEPTASKPPDDRNGPAAGPVVVSVASTEEKIRAFVDRYCRTYARKDLDGFLGLFSADALENGKPVRSLRPQYAENFARTDQLAFRISVDRWVWAEGGVTVHGRFDLKARFYDRRGVHSQGTVTLGLQPRGDSFYVTSLHYAFSSAEEF